MRWFETEHLTISGEQRFDLAQAATGAQRNHQFSRVVIDHTAVRRHFDGQGVERFTIKALAATSP